MGRQVRPPLVQVLPRIQLSTYTFRQSWFRFLTLSFLEKYTPKTRPHTPQTGKGPHYRPTQLALRAQTMAPTQEPKYRH